MVKNSNETFSPKILKTLASTRKRLSVTRNYNRESNFEISHNTDFNRGFHSDRVFNKISRPKGSSLFCDQLSPVPEPTKTYTTKFPYNSIPVAYTKTFNTQTILITYRYGTVGGEKTIKP